MQCATRRLFLRAESIYEVTRVIRESKFSVEVAMLPALPATSSLPANAAISAWVEFLRSSLVEVAVLAEEACQQGMTEPRTFAPDSLGSRSPT